MLPLSLLRPGWGWELWELSVCPGSIWRTSKRTHLNSFGYYCGFHNFSVDSRDVKKSYGQRKLLPLGKIDGQSRSWCHVKRDLFFSFQFSCFKWGYILFPELCSFDGGVCDTSIAVEQQLFPEGAGITFFCRMGRYCRCLNLGIKQQGKLQTANTKASPAALKPPKLCWVLIL